MGQLEQLLGYLERDGVTEVVLGVGRPIAMRNATGLTNLTARPLTLEQLISVTRATPIGAMITAGTGTDEPVEVRIGARRAYVEVARRGDELTVRLLRADAGARAKSPTNSRPKPVTISPRAKSPTNAPRAKSPTNAPRAKSPTNSPRAKTPTGSHARAGSEGPRAKTPTGSHARAGLEGPRAKTPTGSRAKSPSNPSGMSRAKSPSNPSGMPRAKSPSNPSGMSRAKSPSNPSGMPRAKSPSNPSGMPRAKSPSDGPLATTKSVPPSERAKTSTNTQRAKTPTNSPRAKSPTFSPRAKSPTYTRAKTLTGTPSGLLPSLADLPRTSATDPRLEGLAARAPAIDPRLEGLRSADPRLEGLRSADPRLEGLPSRAPADRRLEGLPARAAPNDPRLEGLPSRAGSRDPSLLEGLPLRTSTSAAASDPRSDVSIPTGPNRSTMTMPSSSRSPAAADTVGYDEGLDIGFVTSPASDAATGMPSHERRPIRLGSLSADLEDDDIDDLPPIRSRVPRAAPTAHRDMSLALDDDKPSYAGGGSARSQATPADDKPSPARSQPMSLDLDDDNAAYTAMRNAASAPAPTSNRAAQPMSLDLDDDDEPTNAAGVARGMSLDLDDDMQRPSSSAMSLDFDDIASVGGQPAPAPVGIRIGAPRDAVTSGVRIAQPAASQPIARMNTAAAIQPVAPPPAPAVAPPPQSVSNAALSQRIATVTPAAFAALVKAARDRRASDLHVSAGRVTSIRVGVDLVPLEAGAQPLTADEAAALLSPLIDPAMRAQLERTGYVDFALEAPGGGRLRANICRQQQGLKGTFRLALPAPMPLEALGLPTELAKVVGHHQGLVVIAGPSGHGKTTTLAALVDLVNSTKPHHILTIEDPIELVHSRKQAVISQREVGRDTVSFARGLKASLREDPDVIVIGELRDRESVEIALTAAETGHLVLATMSTPSAAKTIDRLVDMFPPEEHSQVRASVAGALRAIVAQRLLPKKGGGVVPAIELVTGVLPLAVLIRDDKLYQLPNLMQRGRAFGMIRFDESLIELVRTGKIDEETALAYAESRKEFAAQLQSKTAVMWKVPPK